MREEKRKKRKEKKEGKKREKKEVSFEIITFDEKFQRQLYG